MGEFKRKSNPELLARFRKHYHKARDAARALSSAKLSLRFEAGMDPPRFSARLNGPPAKELNRFATLVGAFADPDGTLYVGRIASAIQATPGAHSLAERIDAIERGVVELRSRRSGISDGKRRLTQEELHRAYGKGEFFGESQEAKQVLDEIAKLPGGREYILYVFHSHTAEVFALCSEIYQLAGDLESAGKQGSEDEDLGAPSEHRCVYCLRADGLFRRREHVYPEALGNTDMILPKGVVCDACNHGVLSALDDYLANHDAISMLRTLFLPYIPKTGKFPKARGQDYVAEKVAPRAVRIDLHSRGPGRLSAPVEEAGQVRWRFSARGRQRFDPKMLGRALYKVALGFVAWKQGAQFAADTRYDPARRFILGRDSFPNNLLITTKCEPVAFVRSTYQVLSPGTPVLLEIFGVGFFFNLEPAPRIHVDDPSNPLGFAEFSLG